MEENESRHAGFEFAKRLRPVGMVIFLGIFILTTLLLLNMGKDPIPGYESPESSEYYSENLSQLEAELVENVFPKLDGVIGCEIEGDKLIVHTQKGKDTVVRAALKQYFDLELFEFKAEE